MSSKKSIFEKLGLVEAVEEENKTEEQAVNEFFLNPNDEELNQEFEEMLKDTELNSEEYQASETAIDYEELQSKLAYGKSLASHDTKSVIEEAPASEIEDKLNVLIGAYEKNKLMSIEDIYRNARLAMESKRTIFIADTFLKTLPENLPVDIKRTSLLNILGVSNISIEELLTDAFQRIDSLNTVLENTVNTTDDLIKKNEATIKELESRIEELRNIIDIRRKFQDDQNTLIEYEIQRIINIVDFIKPKK